MKNKKKDKTIIEYRHYHLSPNFPVLLLSGERWRISDVKSGRLHFHNCLEIGVCHSDHGIIDFQDQKESFKAGDITCIPRYLPHTTYSDSGYHSLWSYVFFDPDLLFNHAFRNSVDNFEKPSSKALLGQHILSKSEYPELHQLVIMIVNELNTPKTYTHQKVYGLLITLYIELLRIYKNKEVVTNESESVLKNTNTLAIAPALNHIYTNYPMKISIDELASMCHLSTTHFRRTFHDIMGASPLTFLNSIRIDEACRLLRTTDLAILTIAESVGFNTISSFNRHFSKLLESTPTKWRASSHNQKNSQATASILEFVGWL